MTWSVKWRPPGGEDFILDDGDEDLTREEVLDIAFSSLIIDPVQYAGGIVTLDPGTESQWSVSAMYLLLRDEYIRVGYDYGIKAAAQLVALGVDITSDITPEDIQSAEGREPS